MRNNVLTRLREDHGRFERLFVEIENQCTAAERGLSADEACLRAIIAYLGGHALRLHHALEDAIFVKLLEKLPLFLEIYDLAEDHQACRMEFEAFASAAVAINENFVEKARSYVGNERAHFIAEEEVFFPYAERFLLDEQWRSFQAALIDEAGDAAKTHPTISRILQIT